MASPNEGETESGISSPELSDEDSQEVGDLYTFHKLEDKLLIEKEQRPRQLSIGYRSCRIGANDEHIYKLQILLGSRND
jgi:hypothetical protein